MAIQTRWDNRTQTIVLIEFESEWAFADLENAVERADSLIGSVSHSVDIIIDIEGSKVPTDFLNMAKALLANPTPRANEGQRVIVGAGNWIKQGYALIKKAFGDKLQGREVLFAPDLDTARAILRAQHA